jgi:hypothetical protein
MNTVSLFKTHEKQRPWKWETAEYGALRAVAVSRLGGDGVLGLVWMSVEWSAGRARERGVWRLASLCRFKELCFNKRNNRFRILVFGSFFFFFFFFDSFLIFPNFRKMRKNAKTREKRKTKNEKSAKCGSATLVLYSRIWERVMLLLWWTVRKLVLLGRVCHVAWEIMRSLV